MFNIQSYLIMMSKPVEYIIVILVVLAIVGLSVLLFFSIKKERIKVRYEKSLTASGVLSKAEINNVVSAYISRAGNETRFSLIHLDIDDFQELTDAFGEVETRRVFEVIVGRMKDILPKSAKIGRLEKTTLLVFINTPISRNQAYDTGLTLKKEVNRKIEIFGGETINVSTSIAIAQYPIDGRNYSQILHSLQLTSYIIKRQGGNVVKMFTSDLEENTDSEQMEYYYETRRAIENNEFLLNYSPILEIEDPKKVYMVEAKLSWNHPVHGILKANKFLNILEQSGDIYKVGLWSLDLAINSFRQLNTKNPDEKIKVILNISPRQMVMDNLPQDFLKIVKKHQIDPSNIILSVGEFTLFEKQKMIQENIKKLMSIGFKIAITNLVVDYATLSQLEDFPINIIKFNSNFLDEISESKHTMIKLLREVTSKRNIEIIAEKVETHTVFEALKSLGIKYGQGRYFMEVMSVQDLILYIETGEITKTAAQFAPADDKDIMEKMKSKSKNNSKK